MANGQGTPLIHIRGAVMSGSVSTDCTLHFTPNLPTARMVVLGDWRKAASILLLGVCCDISNLMCVLKTS